ncbi:MAG: helix-turn-helix transcriptional regulator [Gemmatimonadales bacterium]
MSLLHPASVTVAAVVSAQERASLEAAGVGCFSVVHRPTLPEALRAVRERPVDAIVFSIHDCQGTEVQEIDKLVRRFPDIPTVALLTRQDPNAPEALLRLGATGVRHVVDVTGPAGWSRLRRIVAEPASRAAARITARVLSALPELPMDTRLFLEIMIRVAPTTPVARHLASQTRMRPSTLMSRFQRANLPSPKTYMAAIRLLYAAQYFENEALSVADVAYRLVYSSPQSLGRHLRAMLGITAGEFRRRFTFDSAIDRFVALLIYPFARQWMAFHPLVAGRPGRPPKDAGVRTPRVDGIAASLPPGSLQDNWSKLLDRRRPSGGHAEHPPA